MSMIHVICVVFYCYVLLLFDANENDEKDSE